jgi:hypothetical protein
MKRTTRQTLVDERVCDLEGRVQRLRASADSYAAAGDDAFALEQYLNAGQLYGTSEEYRHRATELAARLDAVATGASGGRPAVPWSIGKWLRQRRSRRERHERTHRVRRP